MITWGLMNALEPVVPYLCVPQTSVYKQGVEALTKHKLNIVQGANGDIGNVEKQLVEGQIEESLNIAKDELKLAESMLEWKACVSQSTWLSALVDSYSLVGSLWKRSRCPVNGNTLAIHRVQCLRSIAGLVGGNVTRPVAEGVL